MNIMKLIGSRVEEEYRQRMSASRASVFGVESNDPLKHIVRRLGYDTTKAILLDHIPEQGEDIYTVLVMPEDIIMIEIERGNESSEPLLEFQTLKDYQRTLTKSSRTHLAVALDIMGHER